MLTKLQERWYFLLILMDAAGMAWARTRRTFCDLLDILVALVGLLLDTETLRNKFYAIDFSRSMHYNPLAYIRNEADILKFVNTLIANTKGEGKEGDPFWTKSETLLYGCQNYIFKTETPIMTSLFFFPPKKQTLLWREEGMCQTFSIFSVISVERRPFHGQEFPLGEWFSGPAHQ